MWCCREAGVSTTTCWSASWAPQSWASSSWTSSRRKFVGSGGSDASQDVTHQYFCQKFKSVMLLKTSVQFSDQVKELEIRESSQYHWKCKFLWPWIQSIVAFQTMRAARLNKELVMMEKSPPPGASCWQVLCLRLNRLCINFASCKILYQSGHLWESENKVGDSKEKLEAAIMGPEGSPYQVQCRIDVPPKFSLKPMCREVFSSWRYPFQSVIPWSLHRWGSYYPYWKLNKLRNNWNYTGILECRPKKPFVPH